MLSGHLQCHQREDPFDPSSAFFVVGQALGLARLVGVPLEAVAAVFAPNAE